MQTRYYVTLTSPQGDHQLPDVDEFAALTKAALAAMPELHAVTIDVVRFTEEGKTFQRVEDGPYEDRFKSGAPV